jgi:hypothetical protein
MKHSLKCFKKSNKLNPQFLYSYLKMAEIYTQMSNYPKAIKVNIQLFRPMKDLLPLTLGQ